MTLFRWSEPCLSAPTQPIWSRPPPMGAPWAGLEGGCPPFSLRMGGFGAGGQKPPDFSTKGNDRFWVWVVRPTKSRISRDKALARGASHSPPRGAAIFPAMTMGKPTCKHWEHSHRPSPSRKPSFHSISVMRRFWVCLFGTARSAHQNARWSECPTHDHKRRVNPFNIAGSAQPRFVSGFRVSKSFFFFFAPPPGHKEAKSSLSFLAS